MKKLMAANWKMYKTSAEARETAMKLKKLLAGYGEREVVVFAPFTALEATAEALAGVAETGAQNLYPATEGAFTGEISPAMILATKATWVLAGHSERRHIIGESDALVAQKTAFALENCLKVVLCIGETLEERESGHLETVLARQLESALATLNFNPAHLAVAYEPVWAIGTGKTAGSHDIVAAHAEVRAILKRICHEKAGEIRILYGGSVKPENAASIIALDNVDGVLVGGASLKADSFSNIALA